MKYYYVEGKRLKFSNQKEHSKSVAASQRYEGPNAKGRLREDNFKSFLCDTLYLFVEILS